MLAHGLFTQRPAGSPASGRPGLFSPDNIRMVSVLKMISDEKNTTIEKLVQAYVCAKHPDMRILIGTTSRQHLQDSIDALSLELTADDIQKIENAFPTDQMVNIFSEWSPIAE